MNNGLETGGMSWADMVEEDLEQQQHPSLDKDSLDGGDSPITDAPPPPPLTRSWASLVAGRLHDNEPRQPPPPPPPAQQQTLVDNDMGSDSNKSSRAETETNIQVSQWHVYAKKLQEEEAAEEAARRAKADAAGPMPLPSDGLAQTTYNSSQENDKVQGLESSRWANKQRDDMNPNDDNYQSIDSKSVGEGLAASRWANAPSPRPRYGGHNNQFGGSPDYNNSGSRFNKFYGDRDRDDRSNRYDNGDRRYDNNGSSWNDYGDRTGSSRGETNNWRAGYGNGNGYSQRRYDGNDNGYSQRRYDGNDNGYSQRRYDGSDNGYSQRRHNNNYRNDDEDRTSRPWPRGESEQTDLKEILPTGGARESKWAQSHEPPTQSKWGSLPPDSPSIDLDTQNNNTTIESLNDTTESVTTNKDDAPLSTITTTFAAMTTIQPSTESVDNDNGSQGQDNATTTEESSAESGGTTWKEDSVAAGDTAWNESTATVTAPSWESGAESATEKASSSWGATTATTTEEAPEWGTNQVEQAPAEPSVRITTWKDMIGAPIDNDNEPGLANQAWKLAAAAAPPRTRRMSSSAHSATHSQGTHGSNIPHSSNDSRTSGQAPTPSWSMDDTKTDDLPAPSWSTENTKTDDLPAPSWSMDNAKTDDLPAPSWSTENTKTDDLPTPSWQALENTSQDSSFTYTHDKVPPLVVDQPQEQPSTKDEVNPWKAFASKEVERHPRLPQNLHTRPLPREEQQHTSSGYHSISESSHSTATVDHVGSHSANTTQPQDDSWENLQSKMANSWST